MFPNSAKPSLAPLLTRLLGSVISFKRQAPSARAASADSTRATVGRPAFQALGLVQ